MTSKKRSAFSLLEIIAAVIILAVVATATVSTVAPMRTKSDAKMQQVELAELNGLAQTCYAEYSVWPVRNGGVWDLYARGYLSATQYNSLRQKWQWNDTRKLFEKKTT